MHEDDPASIVLDHDVLRERHVPDKLIDRGTQIEQIMDCLNPAVRKRMPIHVWLYGNSGSGKTVTAKYILDRLQEQHGVTGMVVNCWEKRSFYEILDEMVSELKILRADAHRTSFKLEKLCRHLEDRPFVIVLDEIDRIKPNERSSTLYNLHSILNVSLICISASQNVLFGLEQRVRSRLSPHVVFFPEYSSKNLLEILRHRARTALTEGSWSDNSLKLIASSANGDARVAIRSLRKAAIVAEHKHSAKIYVKNLAEEAKAVRQARCESVLDNLTCDHRIIYEIVKQQQKVLSANLREAYLCSCAKSKRKPLAPRTFSEYCNGLIHTGLITSERARVRGKVRLFTTAM